ncbi:MAG: DUF1684 domain-containing protein, partial [Acidobacteriota bacterium]
MRLTIALAVALALTSCSEPSATIDPAYTAEIQKWRADRETRLKAEDGWLTLVGLFWLKEGANRIGSDPNSEVPLPGSVPKQVGTITLAKGTAHFKPTPSVALKATDLIDDNKPNYNVQTIGTVHFYLIERGGRFGIRVKDPQSPARTSFTGLHWYTPDPTWNVEATLK